MKKFISLCIAWCLCLSLWAGKHYTVIVSLDGFRWDYPKMYDTPFFDQMAREGMRFTQAYAGSPVSAPSRASLMTGQHSGHGHVRGNKEYWSGEVWWPIRSGTRNAKSSTR